MFIKAIGQKNLKNANQSPAIPNQDKFKGEKDVRLCNHFSRFNSAKSIKKEERETHNSHLSASRSK